MAVIGPMALRHQPARKKRRFGQNLLGITYITDDFDGPLPPDLQKYFD
jgi:hypothetical protein